MQNIRMVEQIKKFRDHVKVSRFPEWKIFQNAEIHVGHERVVKRVPAGAKRPGGKRKCVTQVGIEARQRVHGLSAARRENRCDFDVLERARQPTRFGFLIRGLVLIVADRQFPQGVEHETLQLILKRECVFRRKAEWDFAAVR